MNADSKVLRAAANQKSAPQYFDTESDQYEYLQGRDGGSFVHVLGYNPVSDLNLEVGEQAVGFESIPLTAQQALITVENATIRYRVTGAAPTSVLGHKVYADDAIILDTRKQLFDFRAIRLGDVDAVLQVTFFQGVK